MVLRTRGNEKAFGGAAQTVKNPIHHSFGGENSTRLLSVLFVSKAEHRPVERERDWEPNDRLIAITSARQRLPALPLLSLLSLLLPFLPGWGKLEDWEK